MTIKQYPCCTVLDMGGGVWTGIIVAGCCVFVQIIVSMVLIGRFDRLPAPQGCCRWYAGKSGQEVLQQADPEAFPSTGDTEEGEAGGDGDGGGDRGTETSPTKAPRQSKLFRMFNRDSAAEVTGQQRPSISVVADGRSEAASAAVAAALAAEAGRRRSSAPPPPSAPPAPQY